MRILYVNTVPTSKNGITNVIFNLLTHMPRNNIDFGYVSINKPDEAYANLIKNNNLKLYIIPRNYKSPIRYIRQLSKVAKDYDIMHVHGNSATMVLEMCAAKLAGVNVRIAHSHNTTCSMKLIDKLMRPLFYNLCNGRMACGKEAGLWLFNNNEFTILNNGVDTKRFRFDPIKREKIRKELGLDNKIIIGNVGNFVTQKNHSFLIDVFKELTKTNPKLQLLLLGSGPLLGDIQNQIHNLDLDKRVIFAGSVDNPEVYMSAMDLVIMPSLFEGLPLTLVEEQANGLQCIVADTITRDADMTGNLKFLSLDSPISEWVSEIEDTVSNHNIDRMEMSDQVLIC